MSASATQLKTPSSFISFPVFDRIAETAREAARPAYTVAVKPILDAQAVTAVRLLQNQTAAALRQSIPTVAAMSEVIAQLQPALNEIVATAQAVTLRARNIVPESTLLGRAPSQRDHPMDALELAPWRAGLAVDPRMPARALDAWDLCMSDPMLATLVGLLILAVASGDPGLHNLTIRIAQAIGDIWLEHGLKRVGINPLRALDL